MLLNDENVSEYIRGVIANADDISVYENEICYINFPTAVLVTVGWDSFDLYTVDSEGESVFVGVFDLTDEISNMFKTSVEACK